MASKTKVPTFSLLCTGCKMKEDRPAAECREMPFCNECHFPMVLDKVKI